VLLGCTHYPLFARIIAEVMGPDIALVDSAEATADAVAALLAGRDLLRPSCGAARHQTFCTDLPDRFRSVAERFLGRPLQSVDLVDLGTF